MASFFFFLASFRRGQAKNRHSKSAKKGTKRREYIYLTSQHLCVSTPTKAVVVVFFFFFFFFFFFCGERERERERERAKGDAVLVVFSASTRWLWWKRTTGLIQTRRLCDFWDYGRGNIPIHFSSSKSRRFKTARRRRRKEPRNDDSFFRPRKKTRGKETTIRFSWPPLGRKQ